MKVMGHWLGQDLLHSMVAAMSHHQQLQMEFSTLGRTIPISMPLTRIREPSFGNYQQVVTSIAPRRWQMASYTLRLGIKTSMPSTRPVVQYYGTILPEIDLF